ncbi:alpha/beta hydrolase, partial [Amycolatopsis sp. SID8362]|nr:alpha/beta hydrolase [Amycolatopsis sp. SID8362]NED48699.1 alpha/beta hydrolase [Amycolatopsis sp. SID8362]
MSTGLDPAVRELLAHSPEAPDRPLTAVELRAAFAA